MVSNLDFIQQDMRGFSRMPQCAHEAGRPTLPWLRVGGSRVRVLIPGPIRFLRSVGIRPLPLLDELIFAAATGRPSRCASCCFASSSLVWDDSPILHELWGVLAFVTWPPAPSLGVVVVHPNRESITDRLCRWSITTGVLAQ